MKKLVLVAAGKDRPGIVAGLTEVLYHMGCNLEDTSMIQLEDHFTVMMMLHAPPAIAIAEMETVLAEKLAAFELALNLYPVDVEQERKPRSGQPWMMSVTSADQMGIIYHIARLLSQYGVNIFQLASRRLPQSSGASPLYLVSLEIDVPETLAAADFQAKLDELADAHQFDIQAHALETFLL